MTAQELIKLLKNFPPDTRVFGFLDGDRHAIDGVDMWDDSHVDLNLKPA